ncbi:MAG: hypothetical protein JW918_20835 [Anaerolineae bacterium]|nr:hypothetical protein [Anaerolineae bacterium]
MISRTDLGGGRVTYASPVHGPHCHLVCRRCGCLIEADYGLIKPLERQLGERYAFTADLHHFAISGLCAECEARLSQDTDED